MMTLGTIGAFGFPDFHPPEILGLYAEAGCTIVQVYRNRSGRFPANDIRLVCEDAGLQIDSIHGHFGDDLDPSNEDETVRQTTMALYAAEADYCRDLGGNMVVVHPSPAHAAEGDLNRRYTQLHRSFDDLARIGEQAGVSFGIENMPPFHPVGTDLPRLVRTIAAADSDHVRFVFDTGHAHMTCGIEEALAAAGPHIRHTHVHDNDGANDTHSLPYRGTLPWDRCADGLRNAGYDGVFLLEVFELADDLRKLMTDDWKRNIRAILNGTPS